MNADVAKPFDPQLWLRNSRTLGARIARIAVVLSLWFCILLLVFINGHYLARVFLLIGVVSVSDQVSTWYGGSIVSAWWGRRRPGSE